MAKAIKLWPIDKLIPYVNNARTHSAEQVAKIAASMVEFGFTNPVLIDGEAGIIAGHGRVLAANTLGLREVPVIELTHLSEAQKRAYILADNRLALDAGWDEDMLAAELADLRADGYDLALTGFNDDELQGLLDMNDAVAEGETDVDDAPEVAETPQAKQGQVWLLGRHRLMCGDSTHPDDVAKLMGGALADCLWTDPPYNVAYESELAGSIKNDSMPDHEFYSFLLKFYNNAYAHMKDGAAIYVAHADLEGVNFRRAFKDAGFKLSGCLVWKKNALVLGRSDYQWIHEPILYGWKASGPHTWYGDRKQTTVIDYKDAPFQKTGENEYLLTIGDVDLSIRGTDLVIEQILGSIIHHEKPSRSAEHPTMKPVGLIEKMLENSTKAGDLVMDLFGGSGSTLMACEQMGRRAALMEYDEKFVDVIIKRWQNFTGQAAVLEGDGRTYAQVVKGAGE